MDALVKTELKLPLRTAPLPPLSLFEAASIYDVIYIYIYVCLFWNYVDQASVPGLPVPASHRLGLKV